MSEMFMYYKICPFLLRIIKNIVSSWNLLFRMDLCPCSEASDGSSCGFLQFLDSLGIPDSRFRFELRLGVLLHDHRGLRLGFGFFRDLRCLIRRSGFLGIFDRLIGLVSCVRKLPFSGL